MIFPANMLVASGGAVKVAAWWLAFSYLFQTFGEPAAQSGRTLFDDKARTAKICRPNDGNLVFSLLQVGNLIAGLVGGSVDPEKLEQTPALFTWTTIALVVSAIILGLLAIPIGKMMNKVSDVSAETAEPAGP
jgi:POT family proton-dependent oligopeptide transporter